MEGREPLFGNKLNNPQKHDSKHRRIGGRVVWLGSSDRAAAGRAQSLRMTRYALHETGVWRVLPTVSCRTALPGVSG